MHTYVSSCFSIIVQAQSLAQSVSLNNYLFKLFLNFCLPGRLLPTILHKSKRHFLHCFGRQNYVLGGKLKCTVWQILVKIAHSRKPWFPSLLCSLRADLFLAISTSASISFGGFGVQASLFLRTCVFPADGLNAVWNPRAPTNDGPSTPQKGAELES